jgi:hypothetical protein
MGQIVDAIPVLVSLEAVRQLVDNLSAVTTKADKNNRLKLLRRDQSPHAPSRGVGVRV